MTRKTTEIVVAEFVAKHGDRYDYSQVQYVTAKTKVVVICKDHGKFQVTPNNHKSGYGCPKCSGRYDNIAERQDMIVKKAIKIHGDRYDYSQVDLTGSDKMDIICSEHGLFSQSIIAHITNKSGCPQCGREAASKKKRLSKKEFIRKSIEVHGNRYNYSEVIYKGAHVPVTIICPEHGNFDVTPANHWSNQVMCLSCRNKYGSKAELFIKDWLDTHGVKYKREHTYPDLLSPLGNKLRYDFWLSEYNILIEYDGEQHSRPLSYSTDRDPNVIFEYIRTHDEIKTAYAERNAITLFRISFDDDIDLALQKLEELMSERHQEIVMENYNDTKLQFNSN